MNLAETMAAIAAAAVVAGGIGSAVVLSKRAEQGMVTTDDRSELINNMMYHLVNKERCSSALAGQPFNANGTSPISFASRDGAVYSEGSVQDRILIRSLGLTPVYRFSEDIYQVRLDLSIERAQSGEVGGNSLRPESFQFIVQLERPGLDRVLSCGSFMGRSEALCPAGESVISLGVGGVPVCGPISVAGATCPVAGEVMVGVVDNRPVCAASYSDLRNPVARPTGPPTTPPPVVPPAPPRCDTGPFEVRTVTMTLPETRGSLHCDWNQGGNLGRRSGHTQARHEQLIQSPLPAGTVCRVKRIYGTATQFKYDDHLILTLNNAVLMTSSLKMPVSIFPQGADGLRDYSWETIRGGESQAKAPDPVTNCILPYRCEIPRTERVGPFSLNLENPEAVPVGQALGSRIRSRNRVDLMLAITGDDDSSDCQHRDAIQLSVEMEYLR
ncbi:MAG: hypothetical protein AB7P04_02215 [Bacteriovoracia bacterium]